MSGNGNWTYTPISISNLRNVRLIINTNPLEGESGGLVFSFLVDLCCLVGWVIVLYGFPKGLKVSIAHIVHLMLLTNIFVDEPFVPLFWDFSPLRPRQLTIWDMIISEVFSCEAIQAVITYMTSVGLFTLTVQ